MNEPRPPRQADPAVRVAVFIVIVVTLVIATLLYNAISGKRAYDAERAAQQHAASAAATH